MMYVNIYVGGLSQKVNNYVIGQLAITLKIDK